MEVILQSVVVNSRGGKRPMNYNKNPVLRLGVLIPPRNTVTITFWQEVVRVIHLPMQISMKEKKRNSPLLLPCHYLTKYFPHHLLYLEHLREAFHALHIQLAGEASMDVAMEDHLLLMILVPCYHLLCRQLVVA